MKEIIQKQYNDLYAESAEFRIFVECMEKYSTEEIIKQYGLNKKVICSYLAGLYKMQS